MDDTELTGGLRVTPGEDFPLPPPELAAVLDNAVAAQTAPVRAAATDSIAKLDFIDASPQEVITLRYPFRLAEAEVRSVTVRALAVAEVGAILTGLKGTDLDNYVFYAAMTGLPADVVRALPGEDGERVTDAAYGFLPLYLKAAASG